MSASLEARKETRGLYAGSFDPPTNGHLSVIEAGSALFDELVVAIGVNAEKRYTFSIEEREEMLRKISGHLGNVSVANYTNRMLIDYAAEEGFTHVLRGLRNPDDYKVERTIQVHGHSMNPLIQTVYVPCPPDADIVSSSFVKGLVGYDNWQTHAAGYVDPFVLAKLEATVK